MTKENEINKEDDKRGILRLISVFIVPEIIRYKFFSKKNFCHIEQNFFDAWLLWICSYLVGGTNPTLSSLFD